jgi:hypothetical protein
VIELFLRRTAGLALIAVTATLALTVAARLGAWENELAGRGAVEPTSASELPYGAVAFWVITLIGLRWHRRRLPMWRVWSRWAAFPGVFYALFQSLQIAGDHGRPIALLIAVGLVVVCWVLGEAVVLVLTRPVTSALIGSKLEIPFPLRGLKARLCVREDRLVLDSLTSRRKRSRDVVAVPWTTLRSIELVEVDQEMTCTVFLFSASKEANARTFDVRPGPALHVIGTARELLVPVTAEVGRTVLAAVEARSAGVELDEEPLTTGSWCHNSGVPLYDTSIYRERLRRGQYVRDYSSDKRPYHLIVIAGFFLMPLYMLTMITLSLVTGSAELQEDWGTVGGLDQQYRVTVAGLGLVAVAFLYVVYRSAFKGFLDFMETQDYIEAFPEPPPPPPKTGTVPGSGKKRKKR